MLHVNQRQLIVTKVFLTNIDISIPKVCIILMNEYDEWKELCEENTIWRKNSEHCLKFSEFFNTL